MTFRSPPESFHAGAAISTLTGRGRFLPCGSLPLRRLSGSRQPLARGAAIPPVDASSALDALSRLFSAHCPPVLFQTGPALGVWTFRVMLARLNTLSGAATLLRLRHAWQIPPRSRRPFARRGSGTFATDSRSGTQHRHALSRVDTGRAFRRFAVGCSPPDDRRDPRGLSLPGGHAPVAGGQPGSTSSRDLRDWKSPGLQSFCRRPEGSTR